MKMTLVAAVALLASFGAIADGVPSLTVTILDGDRLTPDSARSAMPQATVEQTTLDRRGGELSQQLVFNGGQLTITAMPGSDAQHRKVAVRVVKTGVSAAGQPTRTSIAIEPRHELQVGQQIALSNDQLPYAIGICVGIDGHCPDQGLSLNR